jgi:hypothetical protein
LKLYVKFSDFFKSQRANISGNNRLKLIERITKLLVGRVLMNRETRIKSKLPTINL